MTELHPIPVPASVWSLVGMDLIGPLKFTEKPVHIDDDSTSVNGLRLLLFQISQQIALLGVFMQHTVDMVHQMTSLLTRGENL